MKKILLCVAMVSTLLYGYTSYADEDFTPIETVVADIVKVIPTLPLNQQLIKLQKYEQIISKIDTDDESRDTLLEYIKNKEAEIREKQKGTTNTSPIIISTGNETEYEILANTDRDDVVDYWLNLHNTERIEKGLYPFVYDKNLEMSAYIRADTVNEEKRLINFHKREKSDNNRSNYTSMKKWFANLGIVFNGEGTEFSENIGRGLYSYKTKNLTEELKKQILKTFTRFMNEESYNGAHYRAITSKNFTKIGVGISLDPSTKKYYIVTHYSR
ncbi:MAG: CAP domain-containing protein [Candidatus Absconditabacteria bacterium]